MLILFQKSNWNYFNDYGRIVYHDIQKLCNVPFKIFNELKNLYYICENIEVLSICENNEVLRCKICDLNISNH